MKSLKKVILSLVIISTMGANVAFAGSGGLLMGLAAGVLGSMAYNGHKKQEASNTRRKAPAKRKVAKAAVMTDEMKIQQALAGLGFYSGKIDGNINDYATRNAIKQMNMAYNISDNTLLDKETSNQLVYIGTLFDLEKKLRPTSNSKKAKAIQLQTALMVQGVYTSKIDGAIGKGTRSSISMYRQAEGMTDGNSLNQNETYNLVVASMDKNKVNIESAVAAINNENKELQIAASSLPANVSANAVVPAEHSKIKLSGVKPNKKLIESDITADDFNIPEMNN